MRLGSAISDASLAVLVLSFVFLNVMQCTFPLERSACAAPAVESLTNSPGKQIREEVGGSEIDLSVQPMRASVSNLSRREPSLSHRRLEADSRVTLRPCPLHRRILPPSSDEAGRSP